MVFSSPDFPVNITLQPVPGLITLTRVYLHPGLFCLVLHNTLCHAIPVVSSDRECYGFERAFFTLRRFFTLHPFLLILRLLWEPVDQPESQQGIMLIFKIQPRPDYLFESQQSTKELYWQILFKGHGKLANEEFATYRI